MIEQDYLLRLLVGFFAAIQRAMERGGREGEPEEAARTLDDAVGTALDMDASMLLTLSPESIAGAPMLPDRSSCRRATTMRRGRAISPQCVLRRRVRSPRRSALICPTSR